MTVHHHVDVTLPPRYAHRVDADLLRDAVAATLVSRRLRAPRAVSVTVADTRTLRRLNRVYRGDDQPTDILSFNTDFPDLQRPDGLRELGTLIIALPVAARGARQRGVALDDELALLTVHGVLHLLGFDHATRRQDAAMRRLERRALQRLGRPQAARTGASSRYATT
ncbi:MAG: rRNA maturation RNase YbeY [Dehalococcoidia bacterium]